MPDDEELTTYSVRVPVSMRKRIDRIAELTHQTKSATVIALLERGMTRQEGGRIDGALTLDEAIERS